jgi:N-methylhydantoinase B
VVLVCAGGGGYGDPLKREPARVAADVEAGAVSRGMAADIYGVVLDEAHGVPAADPAATQARRQAIRDQRRSDGRPVDPGRGGEPLAAPPRGTPGVTVGAAVERVEVDGRAVFVCCECRNPLGPADADPKQGAHYRNRRIDALSPWNRHGLVEEIDIREFYCPACAHMIAVQVAKKDDPHLLDTWLSVGPQTA